MSSEAAGTPVAHAPGAGAGSGAGAASEARTALRLVRSSLATMRRHLDLETAFVAVPDGDEMVIRFLDGDDRGGRLQVGGRHPTAGPIVVTGAGPVVAPDLNRNRQWANSYLSRVVGARAFVGLALADEDGTTQGLLCGLSGKPDHRLRQRDLAIVEMVAEVVTTCLTQVQSESQSYRQTAAVISPLLRVGIEVAFQPIIDLDRGTMVGHEALARFPDMPEWPTEAWFAAARSIGYGVELEVTAVCSALEAWPKLADRGYLSLNVSPVALCSPELRAALDGIELSDIVFEITEHERYESSPAFVAALDQWRAAGARIAVDDAGSGYAGLQEVLRIAPDVLKLDRALVAGAHADPARQALAWSLAWFARRTGAVVVAEGIETAADLATLHSMGVRYGQGFYLGRPTSV